jgi:hypothetical protein
MVSKAWFRQAEQGAGILYTIATYIHRPAE